MEAVASFVCGLDVHEASVVACTIVQPEGSRPKKVIKTFGTTRSDLGELNQWLAGSGVTQVVMEGTGVYWRCVYETLEHSFDTWVVNARHVKHVPGRKSDVIDSEWLATLLRNGLLRKSFIPEMAIRIIRDLTRYRRMLVQTQTSEKNRVIKLLETAGIKLAAVASDVFGVSGSAMLQAIAEGQKTTEEIVQMARGKMRQKIPQLRLALDCSVLPHHRAMLTDQLARLKSTAEQIEKYDGMLEEQVAPYAESIALLCSIDGIQRTAAIEIFAEIGPSLATFPESGNFAAWAGTAPGLNESAGKHKRGRRRRGNPYLTSIFVECALAATRKKCTYLSDKYRRLKARRPKLVALFAIANKLAHAVHRVITTGEPYKDLGASYLDARKPKKTAKNLIRRLAELNIEPEELATMMAQARKEMPAMSPP